MMCEGSCARMVRSHLERLDVLTEPPRLDFPLRAFYLNVRLDAPPSDADMKEVVDSVLDGSGFDTTGTSARETWPHHVQHTNLQ